MGTNNHFTSLDLIELETDAIFANSKIEIANSFQKIEGFGK